MARLSQLLAGRRRAGREAISAGRLDLSGGAPICHRPRSPARLGPAGVAVQTAYVQSASFAAEAIRVALPSWHATPAGDQEPLPLSLAASLEHPLGSTPLPIPFGGARAVRAPARAATLVSDWCAASIPAGARFRVWCWASPRRGGGVPLSPLPTSLPGDSNEIAAGLGDRTLSPTIVANPHETGYMPVAILGRPARDVPVVALVGDSLTVGVGDAGDDAAGIDLGWPGRACARAGAAAINIGLSIGFTNTDLGDRQRWRRGLIAGAPAVIESYGTNDAWVAVSHRGSDEAAWLIDDKLALWRQLAAVAAAPYTSTIVPRDPGPDPTYRANIAAFRRAFNGWLRDGAPLDGAGAPLPAGAAGAARCAVYDARGALAGEASGGSHPCAGVLDAAAAVEEGADSNVWRPGCNHDDDGVHPSPEGARAIAAAVPVELLRRGAARAAAPDGRAADGIAGGG